MLGFASLALIWVFCDLIPTCIARTQSGLVAFKNGAAWVTPLPLFFVVALTPMIAGSCGLQRKQPIFGNKRFRPKGLTPMQPVYPLFSREFRESMSKRERKRWKYSLIALAVAVVVSLVILPWGFSPRGTLDDTDTLRTYDTFNRVTHTVALEDAEHLEITVYMHSRRAGRSYSPELIIESDGHTYSLNWSDFPGYDRDEALEYMLYIKSFFQNGEYEITESHRLKHLLEEADPHRAQLLRKLYDIQQ